MPGAVLSALHAMVSPNGPPRPLGYPYPHFADEETGSFQGEPARRELSAVDERPIIAVAIH